MPIRVGIELASPVCRIVEVETRSLRRRATPETCVRSFERLLLTSPEARPMLASLRGRHVSVVAWAPHNEHGQLVVTDGSFDQMRREAIGQMLDGGSNTPGTLAD